jgi:hypothetical protein
MKGLRLSPRHWTIHRPVRQWSRFWQRHCRCGVLTWPCWDRPQEYVPPAWNGGTRGLPAISRAPLLTRGQEYRSQGAMRRGRR